MAVYHSSGTWREAAAMGPMSEGAAGIAVIVLTILGLAAVSQNILTSIATIVIGVGLLIESANTGLEYSRRTSQRAQAVTAQTGQPGADIMVELIGGITGIVLGVLALIGAGAVMHLLPAALIVFGGSLLLAGFDATTVSGVQGTEAASAQMIAIEPELAPSRGLQVLVGIAAIVLGILAFVLNAGSTLLIVGFLAVGAALLATSANLTQSFIKLLSD